MLADNFLKGNSCTDKAVKTSTTESETKGGMSTMVDSKIGKTFQRSVGRAKEKVIIFFKEFISFT